jgi:hypothetical protein
MDNDASIGEGSFIFSDDDLEPKGNGCNLDNDFYNPAPGEEVEDGS